MSQTLELDPVFSREWEGKDPFTELEKTEGEIFRQVKSRRTFRFEVDGHGYFAKVHRGVGWREIFKNLLMGKRPVLSAANEYRAIRRLEELGVDTMTIAAYGCRAPEQQIVDGRIEPEEQIHIDGHPITPWTKYTPLGRKNRSQSR